MNQSQPKPRHRAHIASLTPGRLRLKLHPQSRDEPTMKRIQANLQSCTGVNNVRVNPLNGSVTMQYDPNRHSATGIIRMLEDVDVLIESVGHLPSIGGEKSEDGLASAGFLSAVEDLNRRIRAAAGIPINLKLLLPLSFVGAGLWSIGRRGLMIESVPGWLFLWFAFDMFVKLHPIPHSQAPGDVVETSEWD